MYQCTNNYCLTNLIQVIKRPPKLHISASYNTKFVRMNFFWQQVQWIPVHNNSGQDFSNYIISYLHLDTDLAWQQIEVGLSKTQETVDHLQADSEYLFCVSVASSKLGAGIRSPPTTVYTGTLSGNSIFFFSFPCSLRFIFVEISVVYFLWTVVFLNA